MTFNSAGKRGKNTKTIRVYSNDVDKSVHMLVISVSVQAAEGSTSSQE